MFLFTYFFNIIWPFSYLGLCCENYQVYPWALEGASAEADEQWRDLMVRVKTVGHACGVNVINCNLSNFIFHLAKTSLAARALSNAVKMRLEMWFTRWELSCTLNLVMTQCAVNSPHANIFNNLPGPCIWLCTSCFTRR